MNLTNYHKKQRQVAENRLEHAKDVIYKVVRDIPDALDLNEFEKQLRAIK